MKRSVLSTALVGFGKIAQGYAADRAMARYYKYCTHGQVLRDHPAFDWKVVIDPNQAARQSAQDEWNVPFVAASPHSISEVLSEIEVAVLSTPPEHRLEVLSFFPRLKAVFVEKPLGTDLKAARYFLDQCQERNLLVQVNLWRRADPAMGSLARGLLADLVGTPQFVSGVYGNGLLNNGTHMVDLVRLLFGEIRSVQLVPAISGFIDGPISGDKNIGFVLHTERGIPVVMSPLHFSYFRENGLIIWGSTGRLDVLNEGLTMLHYPQQKNRAMSGEHEVANDQPERMDVTVGEALYHMYDNLEAAIRDGAELFSPGDSALRTAEVIDILYNLEEPCLITL